MTDEQMKILRSWFPNLPNPEKYLIELLPSGPMKDGIEESLRGTFASQVNEEGETEEYLEPGEQEQANKPDPDNYREPE